MTRDDLIARLLELPERIEVAQQALLANTSALQEARVERDPREATLLLGGNIDGKNAEQRAAQLLQALADEDAEIRSHERQTALERIVLSRLARSFPCSQRRLVMSDWRPDPRRKLIWTLLQDLPDEGQGWTASERTSWFACLEALLTYCRINPRASHGAGIPPEPCEASAPRELGEG